MRLPLNRYTPRLPSIVAVLMALALFTTPAAGMGIVAGQNTESANTFNKEALLAEATRLIDNWHGDSRKLDRAAELLEQILEQDPQYAPAWVALARQQLSDGYIRGKRYEEEAVARTLETINHAIELDPDNPIAYSVLSGVYLIRKEYELARQAIQRGREAGDCICLDANEADLLDALGQYDDAASIYRELLANSDSTIDTIAHQGMARFYFRNGELDRAETMHRQLIARYPEVAWNHGNYADFLLWNRGDFERAARYSLQALAIMHYGIAEETLAYSLYGLWAEDPTENAAYLEQAYDLYPYPRKVMRDCAFFPQTFVITRELVRNGIDINTPNDDGYTVLTSAASWGKDTLESIIALGPDLETHTRLGWTPLALAAKNGHLEAVQLLLQAGADINGGAARGQPPLWHATVENHLEIIQLLLAQGADVNRPDAIGATPIMAAAFQGNMEAARILLEHGANLGAVTIYGETPVSLAAEHGHREMQEFLSQNTSIWNRLQQQLADPVKLLQVALLAMVILLVVMRLIPKLRPISLAIIAVVLVPTGIYASGKIFHFFM